MSINDEEINLKLNFLCNIKIVTIILFTILNVIQLSFKLFQTNFDMKLNKEERKVLRNCISTFFVNNPDSEILKIVNHF